jgi:very-short-patch-repair endonuclease
LCITDIHKGYTVPKVINMKCLKCNKEVKFIGYKHLKSCSGITTKEYLKEFPYAKFCDESISKKFGHSGVNNPNYKTGKCITDRFCEKCGTKICLNGKSGYCKLCCRSVKENPFKGKKHTEKTKSKMKEKAKLRDISTYAHTPLTEEHKAIISKNSKLRWQNKPEEERIKHLKNFMEAGQRYHVKNKETKIEMKIRLYLLNNCDFKQNEWLNNYNVDFLINNNLIIECFGDYWHCNPQIYKGDYYNKNLKMTAQEKWDKDAKRLDKIKEMGYTILVLWENDIKTNRNYIEKIVNEFIKK